MPKKSNSPPYKTPATQPARYRPQFESAPAWCLWILLAAVAVWQVVLSILVITHPSVSAMLGAAVVHWRRLEELIPWLALGLLFLGSDTVPRSLGQARMAKIIAAFFRLGVMASGIAIALDQADAAPGVSEALAIAGHGLLAWCSLLFGGRAIKSVLKSLKPAAGERGGITIIDLWRFAATQWAILMAIAALVMSLVRTKDQQLWSESIRVVMFYVPAVGVLPNVMMAAGISLWNDMLLAAGSAPAKPRIRAWITSLAMMNLAPLLILTSFMTELQVAWLIFPGILLTLFAIVMYLVGFPRQAWQGLGGKLQLGAWGLMALALTAGGIERAGELARQDVSIFYGYSWRHLWIAGAVTLWLLGMGASAAPLTGAQRVGRLLKIVAGMTGLGVFVTTTIFLCAAAAPADGQVGVLRFQVAGTLLEAGAMLLAGLGLFWARAKR